VTTVANRFARLRAALGLSQDDFFSGPRALTGQRTVISKIESGDNKLTGQLRPRIARFLGVSFEDFDAYIERRMELHEFQKLVSVDLGEGEVDSARSSTKKSSVPPPAPWFEIDEQAGNVARVYLRQPSPNGAKLDDEAIELAFRHVRMDSAEAASDPSQVANAIRMHIWGISATLPGAAPSSSPPPAPGAGTRRSGAG
jgi:transcriptional regulator with XRE-family HTH domain